MKNFALSLAGLFTLSLISSSSQAQETAELRWFRGNTHAHSLWSDGNDFPEMIVAWYHDNGYDFMALSDHDRLAVGDRWMSEARIEARQKTVGRRAVEKYVRRFGEEWVEFREREGEREVRLRPLDEYRGHFEEPGKFLILQAEEISNSTDEKKPIHINAVNLPGTTPIPSSKGKKPVREVIRECLQAIAAREEETGQPILVHLNHPNFGWAVTAEDLAHVIEEQFFEVYNGHPGINHLGNESHPGDERIWDIANTIRLRELNAAPLFGIATDDSHHYHGGAVSPGRGWVMVQAARLHGDDLVLAMRAGDFYSSSGVFLDSVDFDEETRQLRLEIQPDGDAEFTTQLIGTVGDEIGAVLAEETGTSVTLTLPENAIYVRATVTSSKGHPNPSFEGQRKQAWTQPVGWKLSE